MPTKRWLYLAVCLAAILSLLSACTAVTPFRQHWCRWWQHQCECRSPSTLDYYYVAFAAKPEDLQEVEDAANAILVDKIGAKIKLHPLTFADITTKAPSSCRVLVRSAT
ncbi:MAG: hypothetical protein U0X20_03890 [Caldilineaceae bacterium]